MENPEAFLDILTIRSLKERYHGGSESDDNDFSMDTTSNHDDLETFVRDFRIDDSISDCFADSDSLASADIGVNCKPSSKIPITVVRVATTDLDLNGPETPFLPDVTPEFSPTRRHNIVTSLFHKRIKQNEAGSGQDNLKNSNKCGNVDRLMEASDQHRLHCDNENFQTLKRLIKTSGSTLERDSEIENIDVFHSRITGHSQKSNHETTLMQKEPHFPKISPNKSNTMFSNLDPHQAEQLKHDKDLKATKKFGLNWVWSNTLKKCKRKVPSIPNTKKQLSEVGVGADSNGLGCNVKEIQEDKQQDKPFPYHDHQGLPLDEPETDFDEIITNHVPGKLRAQFQAKSEPNLGQQEVMNKTVHVDMYKRRSEGFVYDPGEHFNEDSDGISRRQLEKGSASRISSKLPQSSDGDLITKLHQPPYILNISDVPTSNDHTSHLPCRLDQSISISNPPVGPALKMDPTLEDNNPLMVPNSSDGHGHTDRVASKGQGKRESSTICETQDTKGLSPAVERCLLEMINRELVKRTMVTQTQLVSLSHLLAELVSKFNGSDIIETLSTASSQLKLLSQSPHLDQDISSFVEQTNLQLQRTRMFLQDFNFSVMRIKDQTRQPVEPTHCGYREEDCKENQFQIRSLLLEAYDLAKQRPQDLNQQLQLLISHHLNSRVHNDNILSANELKTNRHSYSSMEPAAMKNEGPLLNGHNEQASSKYQNVLVQGDGLYTPSRTKVGQTLSDIPNQRNKPSVLNPDDKYPNVSVGVSAPASCVGLTAEASDTTSTVTSDAQTVIYVKNIILPEQRCGNGLQKVNTLNNQKKVLSSELLSRPYYQLVSQCKEQEPTNPAQFERFQDKLDFSSHTSHRPDIIHSSDTLSGHTAGTGENSTLTNSSHQNYTKFLNRNEWNGNAFQSKAEKSADVSRRKHYEYTRRSRRKRRRSLSETRYVRRKHNLSVTTASTSSTRSTRSTEKSEQSSKRRYGHSLRIYSSSRSASARLQKNYVDDCWSDNESDDEDDDDDDGDTKRLVRVNVENEDLPDEALRVQRLHRHLQSVQKLHQSNDDIIETIITGTGEKLIPHPQSCDLSQTPNLGVSHGSVGMSLPLRTSQTVNTAGGNNPPPHATRKQNAGQRFPKIKKLLGPHLFNHEKMTSQGVPMREMTESEFEETYERRNDATVRRRKQMDMGIPWDQLTFSESDESDSQENKPRDKALTQNTTSGLCDETVKSMQREFF
ncbi:unnamed protein product [Lymnaea stagnalis]|uniref:Uncharacterized protein n=1 Tax=Lymnaea stagnalis TaxID=6523 RepID=A0AAV2HS12_LYMST